MKKLKVLGVIAILVGFFSVKVEPSVGAAVAVIGGILLGFAIGSSKN